MREYVYQNMPWLQCDQYVYQNVLLNNVCPAVVNEVNDLGGVIDYRLKFHTHIWKNIVRAMSELI